MDTTERAFPGRAQWPAGLAILAVLMPLSYLSNWIVEPRLVPTSQSPYGGGDYACADDTFTNPRGLRRSTLSRTVIGQESLEVLVDRLKLADGYEAPLTGYKHFETDIQSMFRNPRTARLIGLLNQLPGENALAESQAICDQTHQFWSTMLDRLFARYANPTLPANPQTHVNPKLATAAAIFSLAHFATTEEVVERIRRIQAREQEILVRLQNLKDRPSHASDRMFAHMMFLDTNLKVNLLVYSIARQREQNPSKYRKASHLLSGIDTRRIRLDVALLETISQPGRATNDDDGFETFTIYEWHPYSTYYAKNQDRILQELMAICGPP